jgi:hypothetical protein
VTEPADEHRDELPADLDVSGYVGQYTFPDIRRRRISALIYVTLALGCLAIWATHRGDHVLVNRGTFLAFTVLLLFGAYHWITAWPLLVRDTDALVAAVREVGFPVGHASAQLGFRGLLSRPTWRILLYSAEEPPRQRGYVVVDAVQGDVLGHFVEDNPEDWGALTAGGLTSGGAAGPGETPS